MGCKAAENPSLGGDIGGTTKERRMKESLFSENGDKDSRVSHYTLETGKYPIEELGPGRSASCTFLSSVLR